MSKLAIHDILRMVRLARSNSFDSRICVTKQIYSGAVRVLSDHLLKHQGILLQAAATVCHDLPYSIHILFVVRGCRSCL